MGTDTRKGRAYDALLGFEAFAPVKTNFGPALVRIANDPSRGESAAMALAILEWGFFADKTFASQVTNDNARQLMGGLGTSTW